MHKESSQRGYTLIELSIALVIFIILSTVVTINLLNSKQTTSLSTTISQLSSDLRQQQLKAIVGDTGGRAIPDTYGVYFSQSSYTLFHGSAFNINDNTNFVVTLDNSLQFTTTGFSIIFSRNNGEIGSPATITITDITSSTSKSAQLNYLGVISQIN